jgi:hypothetical protein
MTLRTRLTVVSLVVVGFGAELGLCAQSIGGVTAFPGRQAVVSPCPGRLFGTLAFPVGLAPMAVARGDFNGDGALDFATANSHEDSSTVSVRLNQGSPGHFALVADRPVGARPFDIISVDVDGNGTLDLVTANYGGQQTISVLRNAGNGTSWNLFTYSVGAGPWALRSADLDADGDADIVVANSVANTVSVLLNQGGGAFAPQVAYSMGSTPRALSLGDLDGDGDVDIVTANSTASTISVRFNLGNGTFAGTAQSYPAGATPWAVTCVDVDADGDLDLATASPSSDSVGVHMNLGGATFAAPVMYPVSADPFAVVGTDVNGDGYVDLATTCAAGNAVWVLQNTGNGSFSPKGPFACGAEPLSLAAGDFDGDGDTDLVTANRISSTATLLFNNGVDPLFEPLHQYAAGSGAFPADLEALQLNSDGTPDLAGITNGFVSVLLNQGDGSFPTPASYPVTSNDFLLTSGDFDGDGDLDLVAGGSPSSLALLSNRGDGTFDPATFISVPVVPWQLARGDLDGDGDVDLVISGFVQIHVLWNQGGGFAPTLVGISQQARDHVIEDLDQDGDVDIGAAANQQFDFFWNQGNGTFVKQSVFVSTALSIMTCASADIDGDGDTDIAVTVWDEYRIPVLVNMGQGNFVLMLFDNVLTMKPWYVETADVDSDGDADLISVVRGGTVEMLLNRGDGTFLRSSAYGVGGGARFIALADFDADGAIDIAAPDYQVNRIQVSFGGCRY